MNPSLSFSPLPLSQAAGKQAQRREHTGVIKALSPKSLDVCVKNRPIPLPPFRSPALSLSLYSRQRPGGKAPLSPPSLSPRLCTVFVKLKSCYLLETDPVPHRWFRLFKWEAAVVLPVSCTDLNLGTSLPSSAHTHTTMLMRTPLRLVRRDVPSASL